MIKRATDKIEEMISNKNDVGIVKPWEIFDLEDWAAVQDTQAKAIKSFIADYIRQARITASSPQP